MEITIVFLTTCDNHVDLLNVLSEFIVYPHDGRIHSALFFKVLGSVCLEVFHLACDLGCLVCLYIYLGIYRHSYSSV